MEEKRIIVKIAPEKRIVAAFLAKTFGIFGAHRFYVGKQTSAIIQLLTLGGFGIWAFIDLIIILLGDFTNAKGEVLKDWT